LVMQENNNEKDVVENIAKEAFVFDFDNVALNGHAVLAATLEAVLKKHGTKFKKMDFAKYCLSRNINAFVPELIENLKIKNTEAEELAEEIKDAYAIGSKEFTSRS